MMRSLMMLALVGAAYGDGPGPSTGAPVVGSVGGAIGAGVTFPCAKGTYVVSFYDAHTVRVTAAAGSLAGKDVMAGVDDAIAAAQAVPTAPADVKVTKNGAAGWTVKYKGLTTSVASLSDGLVFSHAHADPVSGKVASVKEAEPLAWSIGATPSSSWARASIAQDDTTGWYGAGMQYNFNHKGTAIKVVKQEPSTAPFVVYAKTPSTSGGSDDSTVGIFTNTWETGTYSFTNAKFATLSHGFDKKNETGPVQYADRLFLFGGTAGSGNVYRGILDTYTALTGRPFMIPVYGLGLGDSNCYHNSRHNNDSHTALEIADQYNSRGIAAGWLLFNDGYGCGIGVGDSVFPLDLNVSAEVAHGLNDRGFMAGMWSSTGLKNFSALVKGGIRIGKTDVAWVGNHGLRYAYDSVQEVASGIEGDSDSRRFVYTCEGWAGTQKNAVMWTGDNSGSFDYITMQLQYYVNAVTSAMAHVSGDLDGIFGGSVDGQTYIRDLQMKSMMSAFMTMSGWAANPQKQPYAQPEFVEGVARAYLDLKVRLTPYQYSLAREAHETGYPPVRTMLMEFSGTRDPVLFANGTYTTTQFMSGPSLLVAPVIGSAVSRDVYFPAKGVNWYSYWSRSERQSGGSVVNVAAPTATLPLYVKEGSIIPMYPTGILHAKDVNKTETELQLHLWFGENGHSGSFVLYEDDGVTRAHEGGAYLKTNVTASRENDVVTLTVHAPHKGNGYVGAPVSRKYHVVIHRFPHIDGADKLYTEKMSGRVSSSSVPAGFKLFNSVTSAEFLTHNGESPSFVSQYNELHVFTGRLSTAKDVVIAMNCSTP